MATIHIASLSCAPGTTNDFKAGDTYIIDGYTAGEWNGTDGNLVKFLSDTPGSRATIDITAIGNFSVSYIDFKDVAIIGGTITADITCVGRDANNDGILWPVLSVWFLLSSKNYLASSFHAMRKMG